MLAEVYVDESYDSQQNPPPILCVAGYIYFPDKAKEMLCHWATALAAKALPYFHMSSCAQGKKIFSHLEKPECDEVARRVIALTRQYSEYGFAVTIDVPAYLEVFPPELRAQVGTPYSLALRECLTLTRRWAERTNFDGQFAFFIEDGHDDKGEAMRILDEYAKGRAAERFRLYSKTLIKKEDAAPVQSADILAWQWHTQCKRDPEKPPRKDLMALIRPDCDSVIELDRDALIRMLHYLLLNRLMQPLSHYDANSYRSGGKEAALS